MRVFGVDYQFLSCGDVFTQGLVHAAAELGIEYDHCDWNTPDLPQRVKAFAPLLVFVVHGRRFAGHWKKPLPAPTAVWLLDEPYEVDDTCQWAERFAAVFVSDAVTVPRHPRSSYLPVCYDPVVHTSHSGPRSHAVGFIGGGNSTRDRYLSALAEKGLLTYVIGGPWDSPAVQRVCRSPNIPARDTVSWYQQTKIVLNVFRERHHWNREQLPATSLNPRIYEATACGALVISEWRPELDTLCPEMPTFKTVDECVALVATYQANPLAAAIARQVCEARLKPHTYANRLQTVVRTYAQAVAA